VVTNADLSFTTRWQALKAPATLRANDRIDNAVGVIIATDASSSSSSARFAAASSRLQRCDLPINRVQLCLLRRRQARLQPSADPVLAPPVVDRLVAQIQVAGDFDHLAAGRQ